MIKWTAVLAAVALASLGGPARAQTGAIKADYIGCLTEADLDQLFSALNNNDRRLANSLMGSRCVLVGGLPYSMLDRGFLVSKVRIYVGNQHIDLWVPAEAAR